VAGELQTRHPQQYRHDQIVADHGRQSDGGHDHHAGRRRNAADKHQQCQEFPVGGHRKRQHEGVGIGTGTEVQHSAEGDRQHEYVDRQHIQWKQPDRLEKVILIDIFYHGDLKLARQKHHRQHGKQNVHGPVGVCTGIIRQDKHSGQFRNPAGPFEDVAETVIHEEGDKYSGRQKGDQFDDGLESDGRHQAFVALGGLQVAGAEQYREDRQNQRDVKGRVLVERYPGEMVGQLRQGMGANDHVAGGNGLQLQRDIGNDTQNGNDGDGTGQGSALAVAGSDQVGDGGDAMHLADAQDFAQQKQPQRHDQGRSDIGGQKPQPRAGRPPDTAVKSPGRAIHRQRQRINVRIADDALADLSMAVADVGNREQ